MIPKLLTATLATIAVVSACSSSDVVDGSSTSDGSNGATTTTVPAEPETVIFSGQGNDLAAYLSVPPFTKQIVIPHFDETDSPEGLDINAQICFDPKDPQIFVAGEDTHQPDPLMGWGIFELSGDHIGGLSAVQIGKLTPTYQGSSDNAENYGCGFLSDGRIVTTDIGNQAAGPSNGQLIVWYPPFDSWDVDYCKLDIGAGTAQQILVTDDAVLIAQARGPGRDGMGPGIYSYPIAEMPATPDECDSVDSTGAPYHIVEPQIFIKASSANHLATPNGIVQAQNGNCYVSSVINGVISEFTAVGEFVRVILQPKPGEDLDGHSYTTGTPLGMGVAPDGSLFFADIGIMIADGGIGPGPGTGTVRRITFNDDGSPNPPETMDEGLEFPDGIGILDLVASN